VGVSCIDTKFLSLVERAVPGDSSMTSTEAPPTAISGCDGVESPDTTFAALFTESKKPSDPHMTVIIQPQAANSASGTNEMDITITPSDTAPLPHLGPRVTCLGHKLSNTSTWPSWLLNAVDYLKGISMLTKWVTLITKLVVFEEAVGFTSTVSLAGC
jgi:hypothetical protein